jgi:hypothetical protein
MHGDLSQISLDVSQKIDVAAAIGDVYRSLLAQLTTESGKADNRPMPMVLEEWPGGRWFRDLGNNTGHFWGHVQVIKPPGLLELRGPMFMSYPAENFVQYRLVAEGNGTRLKLTHQAFGWIPQDVQDGATLGWGHGLKRVRELAERKHGK